MLCGGGIINHSRVYYNYLKRVRASQKTLCARENIRRAALSRSGREYNILNARGGKTDERELHFLHSKVQPFEHTHTHGKKDTAFLLFFTLYIHEDLQRRFAYKGLINIYVSPSFF